MDMIRATGHQPHKLFQSLLALFFTALIYSLPVCGPANAEDPLDRPPRVLLLYPYDEGLPATSIAGEIVRARLIEATKGKISLFSEFLDLSRFSEKSHAERMAAYLAKKYDGKRPDIVLALGEDALVFLAAHREIAPGAKIIFCGLSRAAAAKLNLPGDMIGAYSEFDIKKTFSLAARLQPSTSSLVIVAGSGDFDRSWIATARKDLDQLTKGYETTYLTDLPMEEIKQRVARLPSDTIILILSFFKDGAGRDFFGRDAAAQIAAAASAPTYGPYSTYIGQGVVGGSIVAFESIGKSAAELVVDALLGRRLNHVDAPQSYVVDARQLTRWRLPEANLPPGTVENFKGKNLWTEYRWMILSALMVAVLQGIAIAGLIIERQRRQRVERQLRQDLLKIAHLNQAATAGALSASFAHELNQPLGAIRSNAEAAEKILAGSAPDIKLIKQILADIRHDDERASKIIIQLRGLLKKRQQEEWQEFDLNDAIGTAVNIIKAEAARRKVAVKFKNTARKLPVRADLVHIQQVILNLVLNALEAMADDKKGMKEIAIESTLAVNATAEVSVVDTGGGIPNDKLGSVFQAFYTTKPSGTGLGLSIAKSLIEAYGGTIWASNRPEGGAAFHFALPVVNKGKVP